MLPTNRTKRRANRGLPTKLVRLQVPCNGTMHEVVYKPGGPLYFTGHDRKDLKRKLNFVEIGGEPCGCVEVLLSWQGVVVDREEVELPVELIAPAQDARDRPFKRHEERLLAPDEMTIEPWHERPHVVGWVISWVLRQRWGLPPELTCEVELDEYSDSDTYYELHICNDRNVLITLPITPGWCQLYAEGRHFHQNRLVVNEFGGSASVWSNGALREIATPVLLCRCWPVWNKRGDLEFYEDSVKVTRKPDGRWKVLGKPQYREISPPPPPPPRGSRYPERPPGD